ncbi:MAG: DEAD/DEAH box helicase, partial [Planctomycetes bacterium]|nr:DEAD/DEAH box helicase [Planctomycetota bacterium]
IDLLRNSPLTLKHVHTVVLDEADEMLKMGFIDDVNFIMSCILNRKQTLFFSATLPPRVKEVVDTYLTDPVLVELNIDQIAPQSLIHKFLYLGHGHKFSKLVDCLRDLPIVQAIIFCNSRIGGEKLHHRLKKDFRSIDFIHGGVPQNRRTAIYNRFKSKQIKLMVATDLASRGLDFSHVTHVINFDFPKNTEIYTHRTGRTARMGREGTALTFVTERDLQDLNTLLRTNDIKPNWAEKEPPLRTHAKPARRQRRPERRRPTSH